MLFTLAFCSGSTGGNGAETAAADAADAAVVARALLPPGLLQVKNTYIRILK